MKTIHPNGRQFLTSRVCSYALFCFALLALSACLQPTPTSPMDICVNAAKNALKKFELSNKQIQNKCECVKSKGGSGLPSNSALWLVWGERSAKLVLLDCAKPEVIANFKKNINAEVSLILKERGFTERRINDYTACGAQVLYESTRRQIAEPDGIESDINKTWFEAQNKKCLDAGG